MGIMLGGYWDTGSSRKNRGVSNGPQATTNHFKRFFDTVMIFQQQWHVPIMGFISLGNVAMNR